MGELSLPCTPPDMVMSCIGPSCRVFPWHASGPHAPADTFLLPAQCFSWQEGH